MLCKPQIDWLAISVRRRRKFEFSEVFTHLLVSLSDWPNVTVVDSESTTQAVHRAIDGPLCTTCAVLLYTSFSLHSKKNDAVEQWLPNEDDAVEKGFPRVDNAVDQRYPHENAEFERGFPSASIVFEQGLPQGQTVAE